MTLVDLHAGVILLTLILYAALGGADFGGGLWDLLARGPRAAEQRRVIERSIAPVWEANHVWLIMALVVVFTAFPDAFAAISISLHLPLTLLLLGIVFRGTAFVLRQYGGGSERARRSWGRVFAITSGFTPIFLGVVAGAITAGGVVPGEYLSSWLAPFPWLVGAFTLALFAALSAVYLTNESTDAAIQDDFRRRAITAELIAGAVGAAVTAAARGLAPFGARLLGSWWSWPLQLLAAALATAVLVMLWRRRYRLARAFMIAQLAVVLAGWGGALYPYAVPPDLTFAAAAAPPSTLRVLLVVILVGAFVIGPATLYLLRVFKREPADRPRAHGEP